MTRRPHRLAWAPPFLVGAAAAVAAEVAVAILLYVSVGFERSLTVILAVEGVALAGGLWSAPGPGPDLVDRLRRRWLVCLTSFLLATVYGGMWSLDGALAGLEILTEGRVGQGVGLAVLAAFPLYAAGTVLGGLAAILPARAGRVRGSGAAAVLGAAVGIVLTGYLLPRAPLPASLLVACIVMLSLGGMIFGVVLGSITDVRVRDERVAGGVRARVEDHLLPVADVADRVLLEGMHERRRLPLQTSGAAGGLAPWDVAVARVLMPLDERPWRALVLGGGASTLARAVTHEHPTGTLDVIERSSAIVELAAEHLGTELAVGEGERVRVSVGNLEDLVQALEGPYDAVFVDAASLAPLGGARALSRATRTKLVEAVSPTGVLVWGPTPPSPGVTELVAGWPHAVYERRAPSGRDSRDGEVVIVAGRSPPELPDDFDGFASGNGRPDRT